MAHHATQPTTSRVGFVLPQAFHHTSDTRLALSPGGAALASINCDGTLCLWDTATGELQSQQDLAGNEEWGNSWWLDPHSERCGRLTATVNEGDEEVLRLRRKKDKETLRLGCLILEGESLPFVLSSRGFFDADPRLLPHLRLVAGGKTVAEGLGERHRPGLLAAFLAGK